MRLLIVEDDEAVRERIADTIDAHPKTEMFGTSVVFKNTLDDGVAAIRSQDYDAAIIDLRLTAGQLDAQGNSIIREIREKRRYPVCVLTGYPNDLAEDLREDCENPGSVFFKLFRKDEEFTTVLDHLVTLFESGATRIVGQSGRIESELTALFWSHLSRSMEFWLKPDKPDNADNRLLRYALGHLCHKLDINELGALDAYHPEEMYIVPPFEGNWSTGDLVARKDSDERFILLTPVCDVAQGKAQNYQIAAIEPLDTGRVAALTKQASLEIADGLDEEKREKLQTKKDKALRILRGLIGNTDTKFHFLPRTAAFEGGVISFQRVSHVKKTTFESAFKRLGSVAAPFVKDIVARFAAYYGRQGQPDFDRDAILKTMIDG